MTIDLGTAQHARHEAEWALNAASRLRRNHGEHLTSQIWDELEAGLAEDLRVAEAAEAEALAAPMPSPWGDLDRSTRYDVEAMTGYHHSRKPKRFARVKVRIGGWARTDLEVTWDSGRHITVRAGDVVSVTRSAIQ
jgi:hypothetical protein